MAGISRVVGDKTRVANCEVEFGRIIGRLEIARVHAFLDHHSRIVAKLPVDLSMSDIDGLNPGRAALQQAIREPSGGGAHVDADQPGHIDGEIIQRCASFTPPRLT